MEGQLKKRGAKVPVMYDRYCVATWEIDQAFNKYVLLRSFKSHKSFIKHPTKPLSACTLKCFGDWDGKGNFHRYDHAFLMETREGRVFLCAAPSALEKTRWLEFMSNKNPLPPSRGNSSSELKQLVRQSSVSTMDGVAGLNQNHRLSTQFLEEFNTADSVNQVNGSDDGEYGLHSDTYSEYSPDEDPGCESPKSQEEQEDSTKVKDSAVGVKIVSGSEPETKKIEVDQPVAVKEVSQVASVAVSKEVTESVVVSADEEPTSDLTDDPSSDLTDEDEEIKEVISTPSVEAIAVTHTVTEVQEVEEKIPSIVESEQVQEIVTPISKPVSIPISASEPVPASSAQVSEAVQVSIPAVEPVPQSIPVSESVPATIQVSEHVQVSTPSVITANPEEETEVESPIPSAPIADAEDPEVLVKEDEPKPVEEKSEEVVTSSLIATELVVESEVTAFPAVESKPEVVAEVIAPTVTEVAESDVVATPEELESKPEPAPASIPSVSMDVEKETTTLPEPLIQVEVVSVPTVEEEVQASVEVTEKISETIEVAPAAAEVAAPVVEAPKVSLPLLAALSIKLAPLVDPASTPVEDAPSTPKTSAKSPFGDDDASTSSSDDGTSSPPPHRVRSYSSSIMLQAIDAFSTPTQQRSRRYSFGSPHAPVRSSNLFASPMKQSFMEPHLGYVHSGLSTMIPSFPGLITSLSRQQSLEVQSEEDEDEEELQTAIKRGALLSAKSSDIDEVASVTHAKCSTIWVVHSYEVSHSRIDSTDACRTRLRTGEEGTQTPLAVTYYSQRTTRGGLIIAEATNISPTGRGYFGSPGIFNQEQIDAWKVVNDAVHAKGGKIFLQLWHTGRVGHPKNQPNGELPVSSSANMPITGQGRIPTPDGREAFVAPRALKTEEIPQIFQDYKTASENAIAAGFDGVELHAANGYLPEQFLQDGINDRTDQYGGSVENRARFLFGALEAILESLDSSKMGIRLSPYGASFGQFESDVFGTYSYVLNKLNDYDLAYAHIIEPRSFHYDNPNAPKDGTARQFRPVYKGVLMTASGYDRENSIKVVEDGDADMVAIGRYFISNPDVVKRFRLNANVRPYDGATFYLEGELGYTDQPFLEDEEELAAAEKP